MGLKGRGRPIWAQNTSLGILGVADSKKIAKRQKFGLLIGLKLGQNILSNAMASFLFDVFFNFSFAKLF